MRGPSRELRILLVEDDEVDVLCMKRFFDPKPGCRLTVVNNGYDGLERLRAWTQESPAPTVVLLDLNLPRMGGLEFLDELRSEPGIASTVVFVVTTSTDPGDVGAAWQRNVAGYLAKSRPEEFELKLESLDRYIHALELPCG